MIETPLVTHRATVIEAWIDNNNHMNMGYYMVVFDEATGALFRACGLTREHRKKYNVTTFSLEGHITYNREVHLGDPLVITTRLLNYDAKRIHYLHEMHHETAGYLASTNELITIHVSQETRRSTAMEPHILDRLAEIKAAHSALPPSPYVGRVIGLNAPKTTVAA